MCYLFLKRWHKCKNIFECSANFEIIFFRKDIGIHDFIRNLIDTVTLEQKLIKNTVTLEQKVEKYIVTLKQMSRK